jgi:hypothetical protein
MNQDNDRFTSPEGDPELSGLYRDLATERAPEKLNRAVLKEAAVAAASRSNRTSAWFRPLAFVATIGLSLAVVMQISQSPELIVPRSSESAAPLHDTKDRQKPKNDATEDERKLAPMAGNSELLRQNKAQLNDAPPAADAAAQSISAEPITRKDFKEESHDSVGAIEKSRSRAELEPDRAVGLVSSGRTTPTAEPTAAMALEESAAVTAKRAQATDSLVESAPVKATEAPSPAGIMSALSADFESKPATCDDDARSQADTWWQCIEDLRAEDKREIADNELEDFRTAYPDFLPAN